MNASAHKATLWGLNQSADFDDTLAAVYTVVESARGKRITFNGICPYCGGKVSCPVDLELVPSDSGAFVAQGASELILVIECSCTQPHEGRPAGKSGCGQSWTVLVEVAA